MSSKVSAIPRLQPYKTDISDASKKKVVLQKPRNSSLALKSGTRLPVPSPQPSPTSSTPTKSRLHGRGATVDNTKIPQSPRPRSVPNKSTTKNIRTTTRSFKREPHGLLTPTSVAPQSPTLTSPPNYPSSPTAPKKANSAAKVTVIAGRLQSPTSPAIRSPYSHVHVADACIRGALIHQLSCGHKIITSGTAEHCRSNCQRPLPKHVEKYANSKDETHAFVCATCVEETVQEHRRAKRAMFLESLRRKGGQISVVSEAWIESQLEYWERVWENDVQKERAEFAKLGDHCSYIPGEPTSANVEPQKAVGESKSSRTPLMKTPEKKTPEKKTPEKKTIEKKTPEKKTPQRLRTPSKVVNVGKKA